MKHILKPNLASLSLILFVILFALHFLSVQAQRDLSVPSCDEYCQMNTHYSEGIYNTRTSICEYQQERCVNGCDRYGVTCEPSIPETPQEERPLSNRIPSDFSTPQRSPTQQFIPEQPTTIKQSFIPEQPACQIEFNGGSIFKQGKVAAYTKAEQIPNPQFYIDNSGQPQGSPTKFLIDYKYIAEDKCSGKNVIKYHCDIEKSKCMTKAGVSLYIDALPAEKATELYNDATCATDPFSKDAGVLTSKLETCKCGCIDGTCNEEPDLDKDGTPDCVDTDDDGDNILDITDNCVDIVNADQKDVDNDNVGDVCDCYDGIQAGQETNVDCGGNLCGACQQCTWCTSKVAPLMIKGKFNTGKIDVVFVPDNSFNGNLNAFNSQVASLIGSAFYQYDDNSISPIPNNYEDIFNFYVYTAGFASQVGCAGTLPKNFWKDASFGDVAAILQNGGGGGCANALGPPSQFITPGNSVNIASHEAGHATFGLVDEYCGNTFYTQNDPASNVWSSQTNCQNAAANAGWTQGACTQIATPTCIKNFWRYDSDVPVQDEMTCCIIGTGATYLFKEADAGKITSSINNWPKTKSKGVLVWLHIRNNEITEVSKEMTFAHPDTGMQYGIFRVEIISDDERVLDTFGLWDPRIQLADPDMVEQDDIDFPVRFRWQESVTKMKVYNEEGNLKITVELKEIKERYCQENPTDEECREDNQQEQIVATKVTFSQRLANVWNGFLNLFGIGK